MHEISLDVPERIFGLGFQSSAAWLFRNYNPEFDDDRLSPDTDAVVYWSKNSPVRTARCRVTLTLAPIILSLKRVTRLLSEPNITQ